MATTRKALLVGGSDHVASVLSREDFTVTKLSVELARDALRELDPDILIIDRDVDLGDAQHLVRSAGTSRRCATFLIVEAYTPDALSRALDVGVDVFLQSGVSDAELLRVIRQEIRGSERVRRSGSSQEISIQPMVGSSAPMQNLCKMLARTAPSNVPVLVTGESGTGKELVARSIHRLSPRRNGPFVAINCGAIPPDLLESELFGHEKGAFTGALTQRKGRFEMAEGGTLLLDEIGDMPMPMQVKLLRVLQERTFERVGGTTLIHCDVRVVAATHRNLEAHIHEGKFREDLFYRLNVFPIEMPPLRERVTDLPDLIAAITRQLADSGRGRVSLAASAVAALAHYDWPGNVRELSNLLERLAVLHPSGNVRAADLPARYRAAMPEGLEDELPAAAPMTEARAADPAAYSPTATLPAEGLDLRSHIAEIELELIRAALQQADGVVAHAAPLLGLRRTTLVEKLRKYGIERD